MEKIPEQIHGVKRLGFAIYSTALFAVMIFVILFFMFFRVVSFVEVSGHLTMLMTYIFTIAAGYLGVQSITDFGKKKEDVKQEVK